MPHSVRNTHLCLKRSKGTGSVFCSIRGLARVQCAWYDARPGTGLSKRSGLVQGKKPIFTSRRVYCDIRVECIAFFLRRHALPLKRAAGAYGLHQIVTLHGRALLSLSVCLSTKEEAGCQGTAARVWEGIGNSGLL